MKRITKKLKITLLANAAFSMICSAILISGPTSVANYLEVSETFWLELLGYGLFLFATFVIFVALKKIKNRIFVKSIIYLDWSWVIGSIWIIAFNPFEFSSLGMIVVAVVAFLIGVLALLQTKFSKYMHEI